jgi:hypothetical protein
VSSKAMNTDIRPAPHGDDTAQQRRLWLLRPVLPGRFGRWLTGILLFIALLTPFGLAGSLSGYGLDEVGLGVVVFFPLILAYVVPIHHLIICRSLTALSTLGSRFPGLSQDVEQIRDRLLFKSRAWVVRTLLIGLAAGIGHNALLIGGADLELVMTHAPTALTVVFTVIIWIVMTATITSLIENAVLFARLGARVPVPLLDIRALTPFGGVAVSSTLAMIGAQAAFPLMFFEANVSYLSYLPGLIATTLPMVYLFTAPVLPIHRRIAAAKRLELERIGSLVRSVAGRDGQSVRAYGDLAPLLIYRREIDAAREWPFDSTVMGRLALYLVIPPLTWVGAALIELAVDSAF